MSNRWEEAVAKLVRMTESGQISWQPTYKLHERRGHGAEIVGPAYVADVQGKRVAVYEFGYDEDESSDSSSADWDSGVAMEFVDENFETEWVWPASGERWALLEAIRYRASGADRFLDAFLAEGSEKVP